MKLEKIKLSGFKSFVDAVSIPVPANLVGIVGPNGCGKSNIIDAVRWVLGESSAKHLRGEAMADVIFNGSSTRKPVGAASVELVFDNTEEQSGTELSKYNSISIKRQLVRDGQSFYSLNGTRCRRRDITDIFLGTGLGSRSYSIIEQGTISRLIEAKPDEMRIFIEEAAGISKYKERRRETETRIRHTRENLERLLDLRDEIGKQLNSLKRQAKKADKYTVLKKEERSSKQQLLAIRWQSYDQAYIEHKVIIERVKDEYQQLINEQREGDADALDLRNRQKQQQRKLDKIQGNYYELGSEIGKYEQAIRHAKRTHDELIQEQDRLQDEIKHTDGERQHDKQQLEKAEKDIVDTANALQESEEIEAKTLEYQLEAEQKQKAWQNDWDCVKNELAVKGSQIEVQQARIHQVEKQQEQFQIRMARLQSERDGLLDDKSKIEISVLQQDSSIIETKRSNLHKNIEIFNLLIQEQRQEVRGLHDKLDAVRADIQNNNGKIASMELLQKHAMGKDRKNLTKWLEKTSLHESPRLAERLEVEAGWEPAVEKVLGIYLEAICLENFEEIMTQLDWITGESFAIFDTYFGAKDNRVPADDSLLEKINSPWNLSGLLFGIYCADTIIAAKAMCDNLEANESVITPDGIWLGPGWIMNRQITKDKTGILVREKKLAALKLQSKKSGDLACQLEQNLDQTESRLKQKETQAEDARKEEKLLGIELTKKNAELSAHKAHFDQAQKRLEQLQQETLEISQSQAENRETLIQSHQVTKTAEQCIETLIQKQQALAAFNQTLDSKVQESIRAAMAAHDKVNTLKSRLEALALSQTMTQKTLERLDDQYRQTFERIQNVGIKLDEVRSPLDDEAKKLDLCRTKRTEMETELAANRLKLDEIEMQLTQLSENHTSCERIIVEKREYLEKLRVENQSWQVRRQTIEEQLQEMDVRIENILGDLPENAEESLWQQKVEALGAKIEQLGAINLNAIEEFKVQDERLNFLNQQHEDLTESLSTLENAINKIDRESKTRFKDTFERVNQGFKKNFPKLFGGGHANMELDDNNLLETGIRVVAKPPGKRNTSIHLLSGGEKALTAVALVFSIFELNPAPFCMLDEVDAPLDDTNIIRFGQLLEEMSETVQFIFITHNKITMEIAKHLAGVTMNEPGVSRMVAVDIDEAVEMAVG